MGPFFGGPFFGGGFFGAAEQEVVVKTGGKGDNGKSRRPIYKPTGLTYSKPVQVKPVQQRVVETHAIAKEVVQAPIARMSLTDIDAEIGVLLRQKVRTEEEEIVLLLMAASVAG